MAKTRSGTPARDFYDAGTQEVFLKGKAHDFEAGAYDNYLAAGLIEAPAESKAKA